MTMPDLDALIERVRGATEPSRELDRDIAIATFKGCEDNHERARKVLISYGAQPWNFEVSGISGVSLRTPEPVTSSLDAAIALAERVLPGWAGEVDFGGTGLQQAWMHEPSGARSFTSQSSTPALALILAILTALKEQEQK
jgi:hypothetical protein